MPAGVMAISEPERIRYNEGIDRERDPVATSGTIKIQRTVQVDLRKCRAVSC